MDLVSDLPVIRQRCAFHAERWRLFHLGTHHKHHFVIGADMSWDVMIFKFDGAVAPSIDEVNETTVRPLASSQEEIRRQISAYLSGIDWSDPTWGVYQGEGFSFEFSMGSGTKDIMIHVRGSGDPISVLLQITVPNGWSALDCSTSEFIEPANPSTAGWDAFQVFRDRVVGTVPPKQIVFDSGAAKPWWKFW